MMKITDTRQWQITTTGATNVISIGFGSIAPATLTNIKAQFERLKLCAIKLELIPRLSKAQNQSIATPSSTLVYPDIVSICDSNPDVVYTDYLSILGNPAHKRHMYARRIVKYIKPMCAQDVSINGIATTQMVKMPFLSSFDITGSTNFGYFHAAHVAGQTLPTDYTFAKGMLYDLRKTFYICGKKYNPAGYTFQ